jgi:hypothetical protein
VFSPILIGAQSYNQQLSQSGPCFYLCHLLSAVVYICDFIFKITKTKLYIVTAGGTSN